MNAVIEMLLPSLRALAGISLALFVLQTLIPLWRAAVPLFARIAIAVMFSLPLLPVGLAGGPQSGVVMLDVCRRGALLCLVVVLTTELSLAAVRFFDVARGADYGVQVRNETSEEASHLQRLASAILLAVVFSSSGRFLVLREIYGIFSVGVYHSSLWGRLWESSDTGYSFVCQLLDQVTVGSISLLFLPGLLLLLYDLLLAFLGKHIRRVSLQGELSALKLPGSLLMIWVLLR